MADLLSRFALVAAALMELAVAAGAPAAPLRSIEAALLLPYLAMACVTARGLARGLGIGSLAVAALLLPDPDALWQGVKEAGPFAAFLAILQLLRASAGDSRLVSEVRGRLSSFPAGRRPLVMEMGGLMLGAVVANGAHPILSAFIGAEAGAEERRDQALAALRGVCLASLWSPFFLALPFLSARLPEASFAWLVSSGAALSLIGLAADLAIARIGPAELRDAARALAPLAGALALLAALVTALVMAAGLPPLTATMIAILVLVSLQQCLDHKAGAPTALVRRGWQGLGQVPNEILVLASALLLARAVAAHTGWLDAVSPAAAALPGGVVLIAALVFLVIGALLGLHPTLTASLVIALAPGLHGISQTALAATLLVAWGLATMVSPTSLTVLVAAQMFKVGSMRLVWSGNLLRACLAGPLAALAWAFS
ncbi:MAG TPA: hypothetical protein VKP60_11595 [Magnetospirillaceae bacterium]|nr:hypothetical protein [Magnetospirillaceae bacterium]